MFHKLLKINWGQIRKERLIFTFYFSVFQPEFLGTPKIFQGCQKLLKSLVLKFSRAFYFCFWHFTKKVENHCFHKCIAGLLEIVKSTFAKTQPKVLFLLLALYKKGWEPLFPTRLSHRWFFVAVLLLQMFLVLNLRIFHLRIWSKCRHSHGFEGAHECNKSKACLL